MKLKNGSGRRSIDPATAFLHGLTEKHDLLEAGFLVDGAGSLTARSRLGLSGHLDYVATTIHTTTAPIC